MKLILFAWVAAACLCLNTSWVASVEDQEAEGKTGNYTFPEKNPCFILTARITYSITPPGKTEGTLNGTIGDNSTRVSGECGKDKTTNSIKIDDENTHPVTVQFDFTQNKTAKVWYGTKATITFPDVDDEFGAPYELEGDAGPITASLSSGGLSCSQLNISLNSTSANDRIILYDVTLKPGFVNWTRPLEKCSFDKSPKTSNVVPIAVGCALAGLVLIVLVAYLIGRTRHGRSTKGYQSV